VHDRRRSRLPYPPHRLAETKALNARGHFLDRLIADLTGVLWRRDRLIDRPHFTAWLHALLKQHVTKLVVCDPRQNALLKTGNKNDRIDARTLAELLRAGLLCPVYHGESGIAVLKELSRSYLTVSKNLTRVMNRLSLVSQSGHSLRAGQKVYAARYRGVWLEQLPEAGVRLRAELLYRQLDALQPLGQQARRELLAQGRKHLASGFFSRFPAWAPFELRCSSL
jgi:hypothetical protein